MNTRELFFTVVLADRSREWLMDAPMFSRSIIDKPVYCETTMGCHKNDKKYRLYMYAVSIFIFAVETLSAAKKQQNNLTEASL